MSRQNCVTKDSYSGTENKTHPDTAPGIHGRRVGTTNRARAVAAFCYRVLLHRDRFPPRSSSKCYIPTDNGVAAGSKPSRLENRVAVPLTRPTSQHTCPLIGHRISQHPRPCGPPLPKRTKKKRHNTGGVVGAIVQLSRGGHARRVKKTGRRVMSGSRADADERGEADMRTPSRARRRPPTPTLAQARRRRTTVQLRVRACIPYGCAHPPPTQQGLLRLHQKAR